MLMRKREDDNGEKLEDNYSIVDDDVDVDNDDKEGGVDHDWAKEEDNKKRKRKRSVFYVNEDDNIW